VSVPSSHVCVLLQPLLDTSLLTQNSAYAVPSCVDTCPRCRNYSSWLDVSTAPHFRAFGVLPRFALALQQASLAAFLRRKAQLNAACASGGALMLRNIGAKGELVRTRFPFLPRFAVCRRAPH
jgi:hypothetical protein